MTCTRGAIHVPNVGPMGDEFCSTVEEAIATDQRWIYIDDEPMCPECVSFGEAARIQAETLEAAAAA